MGAHLCVNLQGKPCRQGGGPQYEDKGKSDYMAPAIMGPQPRVNWLGNPYSHGSPQSEGGGKSGYITHVGKLAT